MSYREELKYRVVKSIQSSGTKGKSLYGILIDSFNTDDLGEIGIDANIVFRILDELLEKEMISLKEEPGTRTYFITNLNERL
tara:strand:- start:74 stop:319 length:246 start_codon:yes stop_codon:yes gene_type:complete